MPFISITNSVTSDGLQNSGVPDAELHDLKNEHFGASGTKRSVKCDKLHPRRGCECQKIGIGPHFRRRSTESRLPAEFRLYCLGFGKVCDPVVGANLVP